MKSLNRLVRSLLAGTVALGAMSMGARLLAQDVSIDYNHNYKFNQIKSYSWGKVETTDATVEPRLVAAIDRVLQGDGFKESDKDKKGDMIVVAVESSTSQGYMRFYRGLTPVDWRRGWAAAGFPTVCRLCGRSMEGRWRSTSTMGRRGS